MLRLRNFEKKVITLLSNGILDAVQLDAVLTCSAATAYEYTGNGYFLTFSHAALPTRKETLSSPFVLGTVGAIECGFVGFLGSKEFVLECNNWGEDDVPPNFRDMDVIVSTEEMNVIRLM